VLDTLALPILEGRRPASGDWDRGAHVVLVSRTVADLCWPGRSAVGRVLTRNGVGFEIAGVVPDVRHVSLDRASAGEIYWPLFAADRPGLSNLFVRFDRAAADQGLDRVLRALSREAPAIHVVRAETLAAALDRSVRQREFQAWLFGAFGVAALAIAGVGLLGSVGMMVARRTREIGIRMALGAGRSSIVRLVLVEQLATVALGLAVGVAVSLWIVTLLQPYLYEMTSYDWRAWTMAVVALLGVAMVAAVVPARRAARVNPVSAISDRR
jgi:putative ABC transport system permease protein